MKRIILIVGVLLMGYFKIIEAQATVNLHTNPSFELGTTGWVATGTSSIAQDSTESWRGIYSLKATFGGAGFIAQYAATLPTVSVEYRLSTRIWVPSNWDGGNIFINATSFGAAETVVFQWTEGTDEYEKWHYLESSLNPGADVIGDIQVHFDGVPTSTRFIYIDAFQIEQKSVATTYCDGDQPGCAWTATAHASTSYRSALSAAGGVESDMLDDLGFDVQSVIGMGGAPLKMNVQPLASLAGNLYQSQKTLAQPFSLVGTMQDTTLPLFHDIREDVKRAFRPDGPLRDQPRNIIYTGASVEKEIDAYYEGGLEGNMDGWPREIGAPIRMLAHNPVWRAREDSAAILATEDTLAMKYIAGRINGVWDGLGPPSAVTGSTVFDIAIGPDGRIYVGGGFTNWDGIANADAIAVYDPQLGTWAAVGIGADSTITALAFGPDGTLYAAGLFTNIGGAGANYIASWNGAAWAALGVGTDAQINGIAFSPDGTLYVTGAFTNAGGAGANYIASWDGAAWAALGTGFNAAGNKVTVDLDGTVYAVGAFTTAGGNTVNYIAKWDGTTWSALSSGASATCYAMAIADDGTLYAGGNFTTIGGVSANYVASWNGVTWSPLGVGTNDEVWGLTFAPDGMLFVSGIFTMAGDISTTSNRLARWNGSSWINVDIKFPGTPTAYVVRIDNIDPVSNSIYDYYVGISTAGTATISDTTTVTNAGNLSFLPYITINRSGGTGAVLAMIRNETTGTEMAFDYDLLDGETLTIDLRVSRDPYDRKGPTITSSFLGPRNDAVLPGSDFTEFEVIPGANEIAAFVFTAGAPTIVATVLWRALYDGLD